MTSASEIADVIVVGGGSVDASVIPVLPSTVTNLTTIMVAEHIYKRAYSG
jgi:hypothetical protein